MPAGALFQESLQLKADMTVRPGPVKPPATLGLGEQKFFAGILDAGGAQGVKHGLNRPLHGTPPLPLPPPSTTRTDFTSPRISISVRPAAGGEGGGGGGGGGLIGTGSG